MSDDALRTALRRHHDATVPVVTLDEVRRRHPAAARPPRRGLLVAAAVLAVVAATAVVVAARGGDGEGEVRAGPTTTAVERGWPALLTATPNRPEVLVVDVASGAVRERVRPEGFSSLTGLVGAPDGRLAVWSGARLVVRDGGATYERDLLAQVDPPADAAPEPRAVFDPGRPVLWVVGGEGVWRWSYLEDRLDRVAERAPGSFAAGVTDDGRLVLSREAPGATVVLDPDGGQREVEGRALAVHRGSVLVARCPDEPGCSLLVVDAATGTGRGVGTGDVDVVRVRSLVGPVIPTSSSPLPVGDPGSDRVVVAVSGAEHDRLGIVDLGAATLAVEPQPVEALAAAVWRCDGGGVLVQDGWTLRALDGSVPRLVLSEETFLLGVGAC